MTPEDFNDMLKKAQEAPKGVAPAQPVDNAESPAQEVLDSGPIHPSAESEQHASPVHAGSEEIHEWIQPNLLDAPPPRPGFVNRWIWVGFDTEAQSNVSTRSREGWRPRDPSTVPLNYRNLAAKDGRFSGTLTVQGMCLMEMAAETNTQRSQFYAGKQAEIESAVQAELAGVQADGGLAIQQVSKSEVVTGAGRRPTVKSD